MLLPLQPANSLQTTKSIITLSGSRAAESCQCLLSEFVALAPAVGATICEMMHQSVVYDHCSLERVTVTEGTGVSIAAASACSV